MLKMVNKIIYVIFLPHSLTILIQIKLLFFKVFCQNLSKKAFHSCNIILLPVILVQFHILSATILDKLIDMG